MFKNMEFLLADAGQMKLPYRSGNVDKIYSYQPKLAAIPQRTGCHANRWRQVSRTSISATCQKTGSGFWLMQQKDDDTGEFR
jgi:hypothetical protein